MTSKLDTAGLVERIATIVSIMERCYGIQNEKLADIEPLARRALSDARDVHEAFTQAAAPDNLPMPVFDALAQEIRRVDGDHSLGAAALAEALAPFVASQLSALQERVDRTEQQRDELISLGKRGADLGEFWKSRADTAEARVAELEGRPDENGFVIGHPVEKFTGEARWEGTLVASYLTTKGKRRYVVEVNPQGFQMIAVPAQLRMIAALMAEEDRAALAHKGEGR